MSYLSHETMFKVVVLAHFKTPN